MVEHVLPFSAIRASDTATAGGKGAGLGELAANGFPVPPGFVVSADAYREFCTNLTLEREIAALATTSIEELARRCSELRRRIVNAAMPAGLIDAIQTAHRHLVDTAPEPVSCVVRSSGTAEDLAASSFAGQHGTYYYVDADHLVEMIQQCWASLWTPGAVVYRSAHGIAQDSVSMAVVVQEMVRSSVSGVAFTVNPVTGDRSEIVVEASWGMGAAIVDGRVTPDRYLVAREGFAIRERRVADKRVMVPAHLASGSDGRLVDVPQDLRRRETLRPEQVEAVAGWALKCESHFGSPQDVEWTIAGDRFSLLQSRPVTALGHPPITEGVRGQFVLFKAVAENFTDPLTPLMLDLLLPTCGPFMRAIAGRVYQDLAYCRPLVPFKLSDHELADLFYSMLAVTPARLRVSLARMPGAIALGILGWLVTGVTLVRTRDLPDDCMEQFRAFCSEVEHDPGLGPVETIQRLGLRPGLLTPLGRMPVVVNVTCLRFASWMSALRAMLRRWAPALPAETAMLLCAGTEGVLSAEMGRAIAALGDDARRTPRVAELLSETSPEQALARLRGEPAASDFLQRLDRFLAVHGHRAIKEFEIRAPRWAENPAPVFGMIRNFLVSGVEAEGQSDRASRARRDTEARVRAALETLPLERVLGLRARLVRLAADRTRYYLKLRENSRFYHIMLIGVVRGKVLQLEADLLRGGRLKCPDDIFFLRWAEIAALRDGRLGWLDVEDRIRERRMEHVRVAKITPPKTIGIVSPESHADVDEPADGLLVGQPASPGYYEGVARVILDPSLDAALTPGEVLVAPYTDPAWTPLFLAAGAAVVEVGSYLSHAGTVAREYGMPCVVDVADCTQRIQAGMRIQVDGDRGRVRMIGQGATA